MLMNGPDPFVHPVTGRLVGPYEWYEGFAHVENENAVAVDEGEDSAGEKRGRRTRRTASGGE